MSDNVDFYDAFAPYYDRFYSEAGASKTVAKWSILCARRGLLKAKEGSTLIDVGCGLGPHLRLWEARGFGVAGLDSSPTMLRRAAARLEDDDAKAIPLYCADLRDPQSLDSLAGSFQVTVAHFRFLNLMTSDSLGSVFASIARLLKPEGLFLTDCTLQPSYADRCARGELERITRECSRRVTLVSLRAAVVNWKIKKKHFVERYEFHSLARLKRAAAKAGLTLMGEPAPLSPSITPSDKQRGEQYVLLIFKRNANGVFRRGEKLSR